MLQKLVLLTSFSFCPFILREAYLSFWLRSHLLLIHPQHLPLNLSYLNSLSQLPSDRQLVLATTLQPGTSASLQAMIKSPSGEQYFRVNEELQLQSGRLGLTIKQLKNGMAFGFDGGKVEFKEKKHYVFVGRMVSTREFESRIMLNVGLDSSVEDAGKVQRRIAVRLASYSLLSLGLLLGGCLIDIN